MAVIEWALALAWIFRAIEFLYHYAEVPDLLNERYAGRPEDEPDWPRLAVIVPALNEEAAIGECLRSLLASREVRLEVVAINDRSTDATGAIMEQVAREAAHPACPHSLDVIHIRELPEGWLGKPHALARGAAQATAPFLLFTDADGFFAPDALARAMRLVEQAQADHLVLMPTPILKSPGERMMLGMMQALAIWPTRLWKIPDPHARDSIGIGCFNLVSREAYQGIGGFSAMRMEVLEDLRLGYLIKHHGFRQRVAFGKDMLRLHWAPGAFGILHGLTKNFFAMCRYRTILMAGAMGSLATVTLVPVLGLFLGPTELPSLLILLVLAGVYTRYSERSGISPAYLLLFPVASCLILYGMARSTVITLVHGGVSWRGTFYPLDELRRCARPIH
jgi:glycosyltransferase involved in cell wall biosynthesis